ncbi:MAG: aminopeptidase P family N-terminal domain-containing protein [Stellaceae bacterium]
MRRGLIAWSRAELPPAVFAARTRRLQAGLARRELAALLVYSNNTRAAGASWACGFVPYWSEGVMLLPREGEPVLVVALTKRVATWIAKTSNVADVISTPRVGAEIARRVTDAGGGTIGVADLDGFPAGIAADLAAAGATLADATELFAAARAKADPAELALAAHAAAIAHDALASVHPEHKEAPQAIATVEGRARARGAEECYVAVAPDLARSRHFARLEGAQSLGASYAIRATVAYKGSWVRLARTFFRDPTRAPIARAAAERFASAVAGLPASDAFGPMSWLVEGVRVAQPLEPLMGSRMAEPRALAPGALVSVQASFVEGGAPVALAAPALVGAAGEAASLLVPPVFTEGD